MQLWRLPQRAPSTAPARCSSAGRSLSRHQHPRSSSSSRQRQHVAAGASSDVEFEVAVPLSSPQGSQLANVVAEAPQLFDQFVAAFIAELQAERQREAEMEAEAAADRQQAQAAAAAADGGGSAMDAADLWDDAALMVRIKALREAERGNVVSDVLYLDACRALHAASLAPLANLALLSPAVSQPPASFCSPVKLSRAGLLSPAVVDAMLSYLASTFEGGDGELMRAASPAQTPLSVDRVQAARLYAGLLEFGYFSAALEADCKRAGVAVGEDSAAMIKHADSLPEHELRALCQVKSADAWWVAVRHIGCVFGLRPSTDFDSLALPYPDLAVTISALQMEPAINIFEHFNEPGSAARLAAKAADKAARGWGGEDEAAQLPDADLVAFEFGLFQRLVLEAAVFGALLFNAEQRLESQFGYALSSRRDREAQQEQSAAADADA